MNSSREFMPGPCAYQPDVIPAFEAIQRGQSDMAIESLARAACGGCVQREHCEDQRQDIAIELAKHGVASRAMIAGEIVDMQPAHEAVAQLSKLEKLREPGIGFDITDLPKYITPAKTLDFVRQAFRTDQLKLDGPSPAQLEAFKRITKERLKDEGDLDEQTQRDALSMGAVMVMKYRAHRLTGYQRRKPLRDDEIEAANELFDAYYRDAQELIKAKIPGRGAIYHRPEFYTSLAAISSTSKALSKAAITRVMQRAVADPLTALIRKDERYREATYRVQNFKNYGVSRSKALRQTHDPRKGAESAAAHIKDLLPKYPDDREVLGHFITHFPQDPEAAFLAYRAVFPELLKYPALAHLGDDYLDKIAKRYPFTAIEVATTTAERIQEIMDVATQHDIPFSLARAKYYALFKASVTEGTIRGWSNYDRARTILSGKKIPQWAGVRIVETISHDEQERVAVLAQNLLARKLLAPRTTFEGLQEKELDWTEKAAYLTEKEKLAVLYTTNMAAVMGVACDAEDLRNTLGTDDLEKLVQQVLVPGLFPPDPRDILATIRYRFRHITSSAPTTAVVKKFDQDHYAAMQAYVQAEIGDEKVAQMVAEKIAYHVATAYPTGKYSSRAKLRTSAILEEAVRPCIAVFKESGQAALLNFLRKDPAWDDEAAAYAGDLSGLPGNIHRLASARLVPLSFIRRCQRNNTYLETQDAARIFETSYRAALISMETEDMKLRINQTVDALERHRTNLWTSPSLIKRIGAKYPGKDIETAIRSCAAIARDLYTQYGTRVERTDCVYMAYTKQHPKEHAIALIDKMDEIVTAYQQSVYLPDHVAFRIAEKTLVKSGAYSVAEEIEGYIERYDHAKGILESNSMTTSHEMAARLAIDRRSLFAVGQATHAYVRISKEFANVDGFEQWMVDTAFTHRNIKLAHRYLEGIRKKLRYTPSLDQPIGETGTLHDVIGVEDKNLTAIHTDTDETSDEQQHKRTLILSQLANLDLADQAAVLLVFDLGDLMDRNMLTQGLDDHDALCQKLGIRDAASLAGYVQSHLLPKLRNV